VGCPAATLVGQVLPRARTQFPAPTQRPRWPVVPPGVGIREGRGLHPLRRHRQRAGSAIDDSLGGAAGYVPVDSDLYKPFHPDYDRTATLPTPTV
jgi:hypothetical protein